MGCKCTGDVNNQADPDLTKENYKTRNTKFQSPCTPFEQNSCIISKDRGFSNETTKTSKLGENTNSGHKSPFKRRIDFSSIKFGKNMRCSLDNLCNQLLIEINQIRTNPKEFSSKLVKYILNITTNKEGKNLLNAGNDVFVNLETGKEAFDNSMEFLKNTKPLYPLQMHKDLRFDVETLQEFFEFSGRQNKKNPKFCQIESDDEQKYTSHFYIEKALNKQFSSILDKFDIIGFHYDKSTDNPELSAVLQIVDDTKSNFVRRNMILNPKVKYVGITAINIKSNIYCYYLVFGNLKQK